MLCKLFKEFTARNTKLVVLTPTHRTVVCAAGAATLPS